MPLLQPLSILSLHLKLSPTVTTVATTTTINIVTTETIATSVTTVTSLNIVATVTFVTAVHTGKIVPKIVQHNHYLQIGQHLNL